MSIRGDPSASGKQPFHLAAFNSPLGNCGPQGAVLFSGPIDPPGAKATTFALGFNLKTAKALGLAIPESILLRADEVKR